jgi:hypothetical protein
MLFGQGLIGDPAFHHLPEDGLIFLVGEKLEIVVPGEIGYPLLAAPGIGLIDPGEI